VAEKVRCCCAAAVAVAPHCGIVGEKVRKAVKEEDESGGEKGEGLGRLARLFERGEQSTLLVSVFGVCIRWRLAGEVLVLRGVIVAEAVAPMLLGDGWG